MAEDITRYADFWPVYLRAHSRAGNRALHLAGTGTALLLLIAAAVLADWRLVPAAVIVGYACAWTGHFLIEGNRPATFGHPVWSLYSDLRMLALFLGGRLDSEVRRHVPS